MLKKKLLLSLSIGFILSGCVPSRQAATVPAKQVQPVVTQNDENKTIPKENNTRSKNTEVAETKPILAPPKKLDTPVVTKKSEVPPSSDSVENRTKKIAWSWKYSPRENAALLSKYQGYAFGDTTKKVIYLTFDEGYENGYTASILDTLKENDVQAAFFVTAPYVTGTFKGVKDVELLKRMSDEGHLICNHSVHHKSMPGITDVNGFNAEITGVEDVVNSVPGLKMSKFFRPPMGEFSELSLDYTQKLGYKSIFFALAYNDFDANKQPDPKISEATLLKETKPGMICLLHAMSKTNAEILDSLIKTWKSQGYEFKTLDELP